MHNGIFRKRCVFKAFRGPYMMLVLEWCNIVQII